MKEVKFPITKTARYFQLGELRSDTREVWIICHGYGQLAESFLKKFQSLENPGVCIIAPEGLHRYYLDGSYGRVGASWMTKEDRLTDIKDYVHYLDQIGEMVIANTSERAKIIVLGFSQGCATVSRWLSMGKSRIDELILYAGVFPPDMDWSLHPARLQSCGLTITCGDEDEFIPLKKLNEHLQQLEASGLAYHFIPFSGKHHIYPEVLKKINSHLHRP